MRNYVSESSTRKLLWLYIVLMVVFTSKGAWDEHGDYITWGQTKPFTLKAGNIAEWDERFSFAKDKRKKKTFAASGLPRQLGNRTLMESLRIIKRIIKTDATIRLFRIDGRLINQINLNDSHILQQIQNELSNGVYFITIITDNNVLGSVKLILTR